MKFHKEKKQRGKKIFVVLPELRNLIYNSKSVVIKEKINEQIVSKVQKSTVSQPLCSESRTSFSHVLMTERVPESRPGSHSTSTWSACSSIPPGMCSAANIIGIVECCLSPDASSSNCT